MSSTVYRVLVMGTGFAHRVQIPVLQAHPRFQVTAVAGRRAERAAEIAAEFRIPHHSDNWENLLQAAPVDVVSVVTPVSLHHGQALAALRADKHLLLEKPAAMDAAEAADVLKAAQARPHLATAVNHEFRYRPEVLTLHRMIRDGRLGDLRLLEIRSLFSAWADPSAPTYGWLSRREMGGGFLGAIGSHNVDFVRFLSGAEVSSVCGRAWTAVPVRRDAEGNDLEVTADDSASMILELTGGARARVDVAGSVWWNEDTIRAFGSLGTLTLTDSGRILWRGADGAEETREPDADLSGDLGPEKDVRRPLFHRLLDRFARRCDGELVDDLATLEDGVAVMQVLDAVREAGQ